jgi:hypothetical protein
VKAGKEVNDVSLSFKERAKVRMGFTCATGDR